MKKKKRWYSIYVDCQSTEEFSVQATSKEEAEKLYEDGHATLVSDDVDSREVSEVVETEV